MTGAKGGRPRKLNDDPDTLQKIEGLAHIQCTIAEAASVFRVEASTMEKFFRRNKKADEAWRRGALNGKTSLRRKQFKLAETNVTMAIFLGKQYLGQRDVQISEYTGKDGGPLSINIAEGLDAFSSRIVGIAARIGAGEPSEKFNGSANSGS